MKGKIDKTGVLYKELPGEGMVPCLCVHQNRNISELEEKFLGSSVCYHRCVMFEGPLPEKILTYVKSVFELNPQEKLTGRTEIHICQGRILYFDQFDDERIKKW